MDKDKLEAALSDAHDENMHLQERLEAMEQALRKIVNRAHVPFETPQASMNTMRLIAQRALSNQQETNTMKHTAEIDAIRERRERVFLPHDAINWYSQYVLDTGVLLEEIIKLRAQNEAAPEMHEALKEIDAWLDEPAPPWPTQADAEEAWEMGKKIRAALSKVEGE